MTAVPQRPSRLKPPGRERLDATTRPSHRAGSPGCRAEPAQGRRQIRLLSGDMAAPDPIAERAVALAGGSGASSLEVDQAVKSLAESADRSSLEVAQAELVRRVRLRSDDYQATAGLSLVNRALALTGWQNPYDWKHRRKP